MGRQNIYSTISVANMMPRPMLEDLEEFLVANRHHLLPPEKRVDAFKARFSGHSLLSDIVHRLTVLGKDPAYSLLRLPTKTVSLREAVDMTFVPIDLLQMKEMTPTSPTTLSLYPDLNEKLIINVTDITKSNGDFSDVTQFQYRVVRDFLTRSFYLSGGDFWISPTLVRYVAKVYSMTIGGAIARMFNLSPLVQQFIQTVFCAFYVCQMTSEDVTPAFMRVHGKNMGLSDLRDLEQVMAFIQDTIGKPAPTTLEDVFKVVDEHGHNSLRDKHGSRLNRPILYHKLSTLSSDGHSSIISLEYPPYFLLMMMRVLSGDRIGLAFSMKQMNLTNEGKDVMELLLKSPTFLNAL